MSGCPPKIRATARTAEGMGKNALRKTQSSPSFGREVSIQDTQGMSGRPVATEPIEVEDRTHTKCASKSKHLLNVAKQTYFTRSNGQRISSISYRMQISSHEVTLLPEQSPI